MSNTDLPDRREDQAPSAKRRWGAWLLAFAAFWVVTSAWSLATPEYASPDEWSHVYRAAAVVRGELLPPESGEAEGGFGYLHVPTSLAETAEQTGCYAFQAQTTADCMVPAPDDATLTEVGSGAARYNPVYYAMVGWPSLISPGSVGLFAMRIVSAALCSAFLASALLSAARGRGGRLAVAGVLVGATPMVYFLAGTVNPNAAEIAAGVSLWAAGLRLVTDPGQHTRTLMRRAGLAGSLLVLTRGLSPLWLAIIVGICLLVARKDAFMPVLRRRQTWGWAGVVGLSGIASVGWTLFSGASQIPATFPQNLSFLQAIALEIRMIDGRLLQFVGVFGWADTPAPAITVAAWAMLLGFLAVAVLALAGRRDLLTWSLLVVLTFVVPLLLEAAQYNSLGLFWQSRYTLPIAVGIPILAAIAIGIRPETGILQRRRVLAAMIPFVVVAQFLAFMHALLRYQVGLGSSLNPFAGPWHPEVGTVTVVLLEVVGLALLAVVALKLDPDRDEPAPVDVPPTEAAEPPPEPAPVDGAVRPSAAPEPDPSVPAEESQPAARR